MAAAAPIRWWIWVLAGLLHGLLTFLAFPPVGWWPLAVLAPMPLCWAAIRAGEDGVRRGRAALLVSAGVLPLWVIEQRWLMDVANLWYVLLAAYLALYAGALVWLIGGWLRPLGPTRRIGPAVACAVVWTALEVVRGEVIWGGYAWFLAAHPLIDVGAYLGTPVLGTYFASFCVVLVAASAIAALMGERAIKPAYVATVGLGAGVSVLGAVIARGGWAESGPVARVAVVQTNIPSDNKGTRTIGDEVRSFERTLELTRMACAGGGGGGGGGGSDGGKPDLIVWPETMFPGPALNDEAVEEQRASGLAYRYVREPGGPELRLPMTEFRDRLVALQAELGVPMLVGAIAMDGLKIETTSAGRVRLAARAKYNSAFLVRGGKVQSARYDKIELMAFGEVVPYAWRLKALQKWVGELSGTGWVFDLEWGERETVFSVPVAARGGRVAGELRFATPICFEGTMSRVVRRLANAGGLQSPVDAIINMTNDGWFGPYSGGREQHLLATRWRGVELGLPVVRAANTGVSVHIGRRGEIERTGDGWGSEGKLAVLPPHTEGVLVAEVKIGGSDRPFRRIGNAFGWLMVILTGAGGVWMLLPARVTGRSLIKTNAA